MNNTKKAYGSISESLKMKLTSKETKMKKILKEKYKNQTESIEKEIELEAENIVGEQDNIEICNTIDILTSLAEDSYGKQIRTLIKFAKKNRLQLDDIIDRKKFR